MHQAVSHRPSFNLHPLALVAAGVAFGILCAPFLPLILMASLGVLFTLATLFELLRENYGRATLLVVFAFASAGASLASAERASIAPNRARRLIETEKIARGEPLELTGVLERAPEVAPDALFITLRAERFIQRGTEHKTAGRIELYAPARDERMRVEYRALELRRGARVRVLTALEREEGYRNPGVSSYTEFLERRDMDARGIVKSPLLIERLDDEPVFLPLAWLESWREDLRRSFERMFSRKTAGVLSAALLGNRLHLSRDTAERFRAGGTFHVLVISGLHITFIGALVWWLARRVTRRPVWQWAAATLCVWAYALGVGAESSVVRAALMFTVVALAPALGRPAGTLNALGGAALVLLVWRPSNLFDPSFQLTFLSVLSIVALAWPALTRMREIGGWRPTRSTPYPPRCPSIVRRFAEALYWSERRWLAEVKRATHDYKLFKTPVAALLEKWRLQTPLRYIFAAVFVSTCVQIGLLPLSVVYFHRISPPALLLNIVVGALMAMLSFSALAALAATQLSERLAAPLVWLAETSNRLMTHSVDPFVAAGVEGLRLPEYAGVASIVYALYYLPLAVLAFALAAWSPLSAPPAEDNGTRARHLRLVRSAACALTVLFIVILLHPFSAGRPTGKLRVDFLDVGQGDSVLLTMPDGTTLLVDGGGRPSMRVTRRPDESNEEAPFERDTRGIGEAVISEHLWWRGLASVDYVLSTHADADHIDGLRDVLRNFRVRAAIVARTPKQELEFVLFKQTARAEGVPLHTVGRGDRLRFGLVFVDVLWPPLNESAGASGNDESIVLRVSYGRRSFLLTGDIEARAEESLLRDEADGLRTDVIKVAHHGSKTSSNEGFVNAARPALAVISVGRDSPYRHPHAEVVRRWRAAGAQVLTTGERGMITVSTDGNELRVETFVR